MIRYILTLLFLLTLNIVFSQVPEFKLYGSRYNYVSVTRLGKNEHPICFDTYVSQDSIHADFKDFESFVKSIYQENPFAPISTHALAISYGIVFGDYAKYHDDSVLFLSDFARVNEEYSLKSEIKLDSGETIVYKYFSITGIFCDINRNLIVDNQRFWDLCTTSIGILDESLVSTQVMIELISMVSYNKNPKFRIVRIDQ